MNLIDNDVKEDELKAKRVAKLILVVLAVLIVLVAVLLYLLVLKSQQELKIKLDGTSNTSLSKYMIIDQEAGEIKFDIKGMATALGYDAFDGEYNNASQDATKCYIQYKMKSSDEDATMVNCEIAGFELDSNEIYKVENDDSGLYQYFTIQDKVEQIDGKLYISKEGIQKGLNLYVNYDTKTNTITIDTLENYKSSVLSALTNLGYSAISDSFANQKAMLKEMIVVFNEEQNKYGVIGFDGSVILDVKYDNIKYVESKDYFIVTNNSKIGIIGVDKKTKISASYDELTLIEDNLDLYLVKKDNYYGIIDDNEKVVIYIEYDQIGLTSDFNTEDIKNNVLILDRYIPVKKSEMYGLYDINGNIVLPIEYEAIGSISDKGNNALTVLGYNVIIVKKDGKYGAMNFSGKEVIPCVVDTMYWQLENGNKVFYMTQGDKVINMAEYLDRYAPEEKITNNASDVVNSTGETSATNGSDGE